MQIQEIIRNIHHYLTINDLEQFKISLNILMKNFSSTDEIINDIFYVICEKDDLNFLDCFYDECKKHLSEYELSYFLWWSAAHSHDKITKFLILKGVNIKYTYPEQWNNQELRNYTQLEEFVDKYIRNPSDFNLRQIFDYAKKNPKLVPILSRDKQSKIPNFIETFHHLNKSDEYGLFENKISDFLGFTKNLSKLIIKNDIENFKKYYEKDYRSGKLTDGENNNLLKKACDLNRLEIMTFLFDKNLKLYKDNEYLLVKIMIDIKNINLFKIADDNYNFPFYLDNIYSLFVGLIIETYADDLNFIQKLINLYNNNKFNQQLYYIAVLRGTLHLVKYLVENKLVNPRFDNDKALGYITDEKMMEYLISIGLEPNNISDHDVFNYVKLKNIHLLTILLKNGLNRKRILELWILNSTYKDYIENLGPIFNTLGPNYDYTNFNLYDEKFYKVLGDAIKINPSIIDEYPKHTLDKIEGIETLSKSDEYGLFENNILNFLQWKSK